VNVDELVREANPARSARLPGAWDQRWEAQLATIGRNRRRRQRRRVVAAVGLPLVLCAVVTAIVVPQWSSSPSSAAAAVFDAAASAASQQPATLAPGQYLYTVTHSEEEAIVYAPQQGDPSATWPSVATATFSETEQLWTDSGGTGRDVITRGPLQFSSAADQAAWDASPTVQSLVASGVAFAPQVTYDDLPQSPAPDVSGLPIDPQTLGTMIANGRTGTLVDTIPPGPTATFERAAQLLVGPDRGMSPALESALYQVLAEQPDVTVTTTATGQSGARGTAVSINNASPGDIDQVVVNPLTDTLVEVDTAPRARVVSPVHSSGTVCTSSGTSCQSSSGPPPGRGSVQVGPLWTAPSAPAVVSSDTSTVPVGS